MKTLKVLIAHENPVFRNILKRHLEQKGCRAYEASDGREARLLASTEQPDVLVAHEAPAFSDLLKAPGIIKEPLAIFLSETDEIPAADQKTIGRVLRLSKSEFMDMLALGGPLLFVFLMNILQG